ncbi:conserved hypothetical protein [uncultured Desulfobacterium sp.]|uniref:CopG family transcriptional regulator n=1 Tax=uncultured Desulfobacterium sp. TaxID=201089 RepID=A0A445N249_9BACT|nr:conserved hypothetical protein [uncultured Desulfobacterium sp.]
MGSQRTIITISDKDKAWLETYSRLRKISMAEAIRRGIYYLKKKETEDTYQTLVNETKGIWQKGDGLEYQQRIRSEWESSDAQ